MSNVVPLVLDAGTVRRAQSGEVLAPAYVTPPSAPTDPGVVGQRADDGVYLYEYVPAGQWVRWIPERSGWT
jgi:hypothetical protein